MNCGIDDLVQQDFNKKMRLYVNLLKLAEFYANGYFCNAAWKTHFILRSSCHLWIHYYTEYQSFVSRGVS